MLLDGLEVKVELDDGIEDGNFEGDVVGFIVGEVVGDSYHASSCFSVFEEATEQEIFIVRSK